MDKRLKVEGSPGAQLVQLIRQYGHSQDINVEIATVTSPPPSIKLRLGDGIEIMSDEIIVAGQLLAHTRQASIDGVSRTIEFSGLLSTGDSVIVACLDKKMRYYVLDKAVR